MNSEIKMMDQSVPNGYIGQQKKKKWCSPMRSFCEFLLRGGVFVSFVLWVFVEGRSFCWGEGSSERGGVKEGKWEGMIYTKY